MKTIKIIKAPNKDPKLIRKAIRENTGKKEVVEVNPLINPELAKIISSLRRLKQATSFGTEKTLELRATIAKTFKIFPLQLLLIERLLDETETKKTEQDKQM